MANRRKENEVVIAEVRISNFRSIKNAQVSLDRLTVLVGPNNAGKTSFLDAMFMAVGSGRKSLGAEDVYLAINEALPPKEREITIDILVHPVDDDGQRLDSFSAGSFWTNLWGDGISQDDDLNDFMAFRTTFAWQVSEGEYSYTRKFLKEWKVFDDWLSAEEKDGALSSQQLEPIALHYIDAKRDLEDDLKRQGSFWRRLTDDLGLDDANVAEFEKQLLKINQDLVENSKVLLHLRENLRDLHSVVSANKAGIEITPVARKLRDLSRGVDVSFSTAGAQPFPLVRHGMGTRSLASLMVFRAFVSWKSQQATGQGDMVHPVLGLEEPEAHLHPQAQRALFNQIKTIGGQRIVSTHSPYFAGQARLEDLRLVKKDAGDTSVAQLDLKDIKPDERRNVERAVIASRGDILFSRGIVLFEGETEEQALPIFAEEFWDASIHELGFNFVGVGGNKAYFPFLWLATGLAIDWYLFSDGEEASIASVRGTLKRIGIDDPKKCNNVFFLDEGNDFEKQLLDEGYSSQIEKGFESLHGEGFLTKYMDEQNGMPRKSKSGKQKTRDYKVSNGKYLALLDAMREQKTRIAAPTSIEITESVNTSVRIPKCLVRLFEAMSARHGLKRRDYKK